MPGWLRFAMKKIPGKQNIKDDKQSAILPGSALLEVSRMAQDTGDKVEIVFNEKNAQVNFENTVVYLPLIPGEYINYRQILPQASSTNIKVKRSDLLSAIERAAVIATSGGRLTRLDVNEYGLTISATSEKGKSVETSKFSLTGSRLHLLQRKLPAGRRAQHRHGGTHHVFPDQCEPLPVYPRKGR